MVAAVHPNRQDLVGELPWRLRVNRRYLNTLNEGQEELLPPELPEVPAYKK